MVLWISIVLGVLGLGYFYLHARLISTMGLSRIGKTAARVILAAVFLVPLGSMVLFRRVERWGDALPWVTYVGLGFLSLLITVLIVRDLGLLAAKALQLPRKSAIPGPADPPDPSRRRFLTQTGNMAVVGSASLLSGYGIYQARRTPPIVEVKVPIDRLPASFEGFRIVQISDIHAGLTIKRDWVEIVAREVDALRPDLIALTGDMVDGSVGYLRDHVAPLASLSAPAGKFFVTGNHEYYSGVEPWVEETERMGFRTLLNEHELVTRGGSSIVLAGVTDYTGGQFLSHHASDPAKALSGAPDGAVRILLAHQPRSLYAALEHGIDLQLSGHTHGGQFIPWNWLATFGQPYIAGLHKHGNTWIYVSRGTGYWGPPVRIAARSEITLFTFLPQT